VKITEMRMQNFRGFEDRTITFSEGFNVLVGDNGTGKTAILEALVIGIEFSSSELYEPQIQLKQEQIRSKIVFNNSIYSIETQYPLILEFWGYPFDDQQKLKLIKWSLEKRDKKSSSLFKKDIALHSMRLRRKVQEGENVTLPIFRYYGTGRLWGVSKSFPEIRLFSCLEAYKDYFDARADEEALLEWYKNMDYIALKEKKRIGGFEVLKESVMKIIDDCKKMDFDPTSNDLMITISENGKNETLPFKMLSDGYRNMLAMVADIAYRCAVLNPHLGEEAPLKTSGMVLIDEIDLHLHPKWQRSVVGNLKKAFPNIQFVVTTHSPFIIQSLKRDELIILDNTPIPDTIDKSIEEIIEEIQGIELPQMSPRRREMMETAREYYRLLKIAEKADEKKKKEVEVKLDELLLPFTDEVAYYTFLQMERAASGLDMGKKK